MADDGPAPVEVTELSTEERAQTIHHALCVAAVEDEGQDVGPMARAYLTVARDIAAEYDVPDTALLCGRLHAQRYGPPSTWASLRGLARRIWSVVRLAVRLVVLIVIPAVAADLVPEYLGLEGATGIAVAITVAIVGIAFGVGVVLQFSFPRTIQRFAEQAERNEAHARTYAERYRQ